MGTWGPNCTERCPPNCINNQCDIGNGYCVWGCDSNNCFNNKCDFQTGVCMNGCLARRAGQYCSRCMLFLSFYVRLRYQSIVPLKRIPRLKTYY